MTDNYTTDPALSLKERLHRSVRGQGGHGLTVIEARRIFHDHHHGTISGALSDLHKEGLLALLEEKRGQGKASAHIYVHARMVGERTTLPHGKNNKPNLVPDPNSMAIKITRAKKLLTAWESVAESLVGTHKVIYDSHIKQLKTVLEDYE